MGFVYFRCFARTIPSFHKTQGVYYYNLQTKSSQWEHPLDDEYKQLVVRSRLQQQSSAAGVDADDASLLDSGIRSLATNNSSGASTMDTTAHQRATLLAPLEQRRVVKLQPLVNLPPMDRSRGGSIFGNLGGGGDGTAAAWMTPQQQIDLKISATTPVSTNASLQQSLAVSDAAAAAAPVKGLQLFGAGSMFLKSNSRRTIEAANDKPAAASNSNWSASSVKGILRDSSLSDVKNRISTDLHHLRHHHGDTSESQADDRKSVRFNLASRSTGDADLNDTQPSNSSSSSSTSSAALSPTEEDDNGRKDDDDDDDDNLDDDESVHDAAVAGSINNVQDLFGDDVFDGKAIASSASATPQPKPNSTAKLSLRSQFSLDEVRKPAPPLIAQRKLGRTFSTDSGTTTPSVAARSSFFDRKADKSLMAPVTPLYDDAANTTDSESVPGSLKNSGIRSTSAGRANANREVHSDPFEFKEKLHTDGGASAGHEALLVKTRAQLDTELSDALQKMRSEHADKMRSTLAAEADQRHHEYEQRRRTFELEHERRMTQLTDEFQRNTDEYQVELETRQNLEISNFEQQLKRDFDKKQAEISAAHRSAVDTLQRNHTEIFNDLERDLKSEAELLRKEHTNNLAQMRAKLEHELELEKQRMRESGELQQFEKLRCEKRLLEDKYGCLKEKYARLKADVKMRLERQGQSRRSQHPHPQTPTTTHHTLGLTVGLDRGGSETDRSFSSKQRSSVDDTTDPRHNTTHSSSTPSTVHTDHGKPPAAPATPQLGSSRSRSRDKSRERRSSGASPGRSASATVPPSVAAKYLSHLHPQSAAAQPQMAAAACPAADDTTSVSQSDTTVSNNLRKKKYMPIMPAALTDNGNSDTEAFRRNQENNNHAARDHARKKQFSRLKSASTSRLHGPSSSAVAVGQLAQHPQTDAAAAGSDRPLTPMESLRRQLQNLEDLEDQFPENTVLLDAQHPYHLRYPFKDVADVVQPPVALSQQQQQQPQHTVVQQHYAGAVVTTASSSELEFFKHRIHMERDAVNRAKEALRTQRTNFRMRQREIKQTAGAAAPPGATVAARLELQIEQAKELTDLEVSLHRTRALLGEKVIRLRHLEQSLQRICDTEKATAAAAAAADPPGTTTAIGGTYKKQHQQPAHQLRVQQHQRMLDEATVSDLSSHSSSGFSSTEYGTDSTPTKRGDDLATDLGGSGDGGVVDSMDIVQNLEHLNAEIREIWEILSKQRTTQGEFFGVRLWSFMHCTDHFYVPLGLPPPPTAPLNWTPQQPQQQQQPRAKPVVATAAAAAAAPPAPTFFDRLETYRQFAANRGSAGGTGGLLSTLAANTIVSQAPLHAGDNNAAGGGRYTTSLVERTQDLRNWLRQAKNEHERLSAGPHTNL